MQAAVPQGNGFVSGPALAAWAGFFHQPLGHPLTTAVLPVWCSVGSHSQPLEQVRGSSQSASGDDCWNVAPEIGLGSGFVSDSAPPAWTCGCRLLGKPLRTVVPSDRPTLGCTSQLHPMELQHGFGLSQAGWTGCRCQAPGNCDQAVMLPGWQCWSCCSQVQWNCGMAAVLAGWRCWGRCPLS